MNKPMHDGYTALRAMCAGYDSSLIAQYLIEVDGIWRDKTLAAGDTRIRSCLSPEKREFFHFSEIIAITRFTRQYDAVYFFCEEVGLSIPHPVDLGEQIHVCAQALSDVLTQVSVIGNKLEKLKATPEAQKVTTLRPRAVQFSKKKYQSVKEF